MKHLATLLIFITSMASGMAQGGPKPIPISIAYYGHFGYQPGLKLGSEISLMGRQDTEDYSNQWFGSPQLAVYTNPGNDTNFLLNFEAGLRKLNQDKNTYWAYAFGLGYLRESRVQSFAVNLGTGDRSNKNRDSQGFLLPTLSIERGWRADKPLSWYSKYSVGSTLLGGDENQFMMFLEFGIKFKLKRETKPQDR